MKTESTPSAPGFVVSVIGLLAAVAGSTFAVDLGPTNTGASVGLIRFGCIVMACVGWSAGQRALASSGRARSAFLSLWLFVPLFVAYVMLRSTLVVDCTVDGPDGDVKVPMRVGLWADGVDKSRIKRNHGDRALSLTQLNCNTNSLWSPLSIGAGEALTWSLFLALVLSGSTTIGIASRLFELANLGDPSSGAKGAPNHGDA